MPILKPTWKIHYAKWQGCKLCGLCERRKNVVLARGKIPCDVLLIGEAPGPSEDVIGEPFIGPAGKLLDQLLTQAGYTFLDEAVKPPRLAFTNLVACIPKDEENTKFGEPPEDAIKACSPRLLEFITLAEPKLIVCVGALSEKWVPLILGGLDAKKRPAKLAGRIGTTTTPSKKPAILGRSDDLASAQNQRYKIVSVIHPAAILRMDVSRQGLAVQRTIVTLSDALAEMACTHGL